MSQVKKSIMASAIFTFISGIGLLFLPSFLFGLINLEVDDYLWVRIAGLLVLIVSLYYYAMLQLENDSIYHFTVWGRLLFAFGVFLLVWLKLAPATLMLFGFADFVLAGWTWIALKNNRKNSE